MPWVALDDAVMDHPKIRALTDTEFRVWVGAIAYSRRFRTSGHIPDQSLTAIHKANRKIAGKLVAVGLWHTNITGWDIHDFETYNPDRVQARERKRAQRERDNNTTET